MLKIKKIFKTIFTFFIRISSFFILFLMFLSCSNNRAKSFVKNNNQINIIFNKLNNNIKNIWGNNEILIDNKKNYYVQYSDQYKTRSYINFDNGTITFETIEQNNPKLYLKKIIVDTLMMEKYNKFCKNKKKNYLKNKIFFIKKPVLYGQILDSSGKPIFWRYKAVNFANYLLKNNLKSRFNRLKRIWFITLNIVPKNVDKKAHKYIDIIQKASEQYGIDKSLILAIIQIESNFNPYAVSNSNALGLMQIVRHSAGRDVFKMKGKWGQPSRSYLLNPENNIDTGTAYLSILQNSYLVDIINPTSRRYAVITAYNSGAGSVLRIFSRNQNLAFQKINKMQPDEVYKVLYTKHPSVESRKYLHKVHNLQKILNICEKYEYYIN